MIAQQRANKLGVKGMTGAPCDHSTTQSETDQSEIAYHVERFVPHEFIVHSRAGQEPVVAYDNSAVKRPAQRQATGAHCFHIFQEAKRSSRGKLVSETLLR